MVLRVKYGAEVCWHGELLRSERRGRHRSRWRIEVGARRRRDRSLGGRVADASLPAA